MDRHMDLLSVIPPVIVVIKCPAAEVAAVLVDQRRVGVLHPESLLAITRPCTIKTHPPDFRGADAQQVPIDCPQERR